MASNKLQAAIFTVILASSFDHLHERLNNIRIV
jgi:hypothetical protein